MVAVESGSCCLLCCLLLLDFLARSSKVRWCRLTVSRRSSSSCSACAWWYRLSQLTWCRRQPSIRCRSRSTTVLCFGMPTLPPPPVLLLVALMAEFKLLLLMQMPPPVGTAAGLAKSPIICDSGRTLSSPPDSLSLPSPKRSRSPLRQGGRYSEIGRK